MKKMFFVDSPSDVSGIQPRVKFGKMVRRRRFLFQLFGLTMGTSWVAAQLARLDASRSTVNGAKVMSVLMTYSPTDTVWELQLSPDPSNTNSWTPFASTNAVKYFVAGPGRKQWDIPIPTNQPNKLFFRSKLVATNAYIKLSPNIFPVLASGKSLFDAMSNLTYSTPFFTFTSQAYPDLGQFVLDINGTRNSGGSYWTLYVNGLISNVGSSQYILKPRDTIEWRYRDGLNF